MHIVKAKSISKSFGKKKVLDDLSFNIEQGRFYTVLGLNGAGKSTLLNILGDRAHENNNDIEVFGIKLGQELGAERAKIGYVSEAMDIGFGLKIKKFIEIYSSEFKNWDQEYFELLNRISKLDLDSNFSDFSRGQKVQFFLMVELSKKPELLLLDEITSVLDFRVRDFYLNEISKIKERKGSVIITTNMINEVDSYTTDILILKNGKICYFGSRKNVFESYFKLCDQENKKIERRDSLYGIGINSSGKNCFLIKKENILKCDDEFILNLEPSLGEIFSYITERE